MSQPRADKILEAARQMGLEITHAPAEILLAASADIPRLMTHGDWRVVEAVLRWAGGAAQGGRQKLPGGA